MERYELPIKVQRDLNAYLYFSYPLCILLSNEKMQGWFYSHFIHIFSGHHCGISHMSLPIKVCLYSYKNEISKSEFSRDNYHFGEGFSVDYPDRMYYEHLLDFKEIKVEKEDLILESMFYHLNKNYYIQIFLDEYYIPQKQPYQRYHLIHESLIYGYDHKQKEFLSIGFDSEAIFNKMSIKYSDFVWAFKEALQVYESADFLMPMIEAIDFKAPTKDYSFQMDDFLQGLHDYIFSTPSDLSTLRLGMVTLTQDLIQGANNDIRYGHQCYEQIIALLRDSLESRNVMRYPDLHAFFEHKKGMLNRLEYIHKIKNCAQIESYIGRYRKVYLALNKARFHMMKFSMNGDKKLVLDVINSLSSIKDKELQILKEIYSMRNI